MTVWDADALGAPHTLRELAHDGEPAPGSTTETENATCPSAGGFGGLAVVRPLAWVHGAKFCGQDQSYADTELGTWSMTAYRGRGGRWAYTDFAGNDSEGHWLTRDECQAAAQADYEARILQALERIITPQAILSAIAAEKAEWPHAGVMHDGARTACDAIAERVKKLMGVA